MAAYSPGAAAASTTGHLNFSTLDYLGLAEGGDHLSPASMAEVRDQAQKAIAQSGPASRLRANTVSNFARPLRQSITEMTDDYAGQGDYGSSLAGAMEHLAVYDAAVALDTPYAYKEPHRPRAITVGNLDNPRNRSRGSYLHSIPQSPVGAEYPSNMYNPYGPPAYNHRSTRSRDNSVGGRGPRMSISSHTSRTGTPDFDRGMGMGMNPQIPTRSLWIGNLDVGVMSDTLLMVFAQYGPIESVRMLPEKVSPNGDGADETCAFVNFIDKVDAVRARDDVLNRLGGHIASLSETAPVRIGFGKIDSAPAGLNTSTIAAPPPGLVFTTGNIAPAAAIPVPTPIYPSTAMPSATPIYPQSAVPPQQAAYPQSPEQPTEQTSMPTRALYIGSIPAPTSSATLLQIFSPFGPVESARVLPHRVSYGISVEDSILTSSSAGSSTLSDSTLPSLPGTL